MIEYSHTVLKRLDERLREDREEIVRTLSTGHLATFEDYKYKCGYLHGINQSINLLLEVANEVERIG